MVSEAAQPFSLRRADSHWVATYAAMASPCEIHMRCDDAKDAHRLAVLAYQETTRIEAKFSRYRRDNIVHAINHSNGATVRVDDETSSLLRYAGQCYQVSDGRFDITSGVLRRAWVFDGREARPDPALIQSLLDRVGWNRVEFDGSSIRLMRDMEVDFGGIGKEYAADKVAGLLAASGDIAVMVNLGGDIRTVARGEAQRSWSIGIEDPTGKNVAVGQLELANGAVATSGDARRFCYVDGVRLGHILDPRTGWPVAGAPRSATVIADTCSAAGFLATVAMLHGTDAEKFLDAQGVTYHCVR